MDEPEPMLPEYLWDAAIDPDLPPGVVAFLDDDGVWRRFPLVEFDVD